MISASTRTLFWFQTYCVAFYVRCARDWRSVVQAHADAPAEQLAAAAVDAPASEQFVIEVRPCRDTTGNHLHSAWVPKMLARMSARGVLSAEQATAQTQQFQALLGDKQKYPYGSSMTFEWNKAAHSLRVAHDGAELGRIENADELARALIGMYIDKDAKAANIKSDFVDGLKALASK